MLPDLALASEVGAHLGPVRQVVRDRAVDLLQTQRGVLLTDRLGRLPSLEGGNDRVEHHPTLAHAQRAVLVHSHARFAFVHSNRERLSHPSPIVRPSEASYP